MKVLYKKLVRKSIAIMLLFAFGIVIAVLVSATPPQQAPNRDVLTTVE